MASSLQAGETSRYPAGIWKGPFWGLTRACATAQEAGTAQIMQFVCLEGLAVLVLRLRMVGVVP